MYWVYILSNKNKTLYIGVTNNLHRRIYEHKLRLKEGFTKKYWINKLVYYEEFSDSYSAIKREKQLKNWHRQWKLNLIKEFNPEFKDLSDIFNEDTETSSV